MKFPSIPYSPEFELPTKNSWGLRGDLHDEEKILNVIDYITNIKFISATQNKQ